MSAASTSADRIVVAFDPYSPDSAALKFALRLASTHSRSIHAVYCEETDALRLRAFPWAREIALATAEARSLRPESIERDLRNRAAVARSLFDNLASGMRRAQFEHVRGNLASELRRLVPETAWVLLDWGRSSRQSRHRTAMLAHTLLELRTPLVGLIDARKSEVASQLVVQAFHPARPACELARLLAVSAHARSVVLRGRFGANAIVERARQEGAGTVLIEHDPAHDSETLLGELAYRWSGSLLYLR